MHVIWAILVSLVVALHNKTRVCITGSGQLGTRDCAVPQLRAATLFACFCIIPPPLGHPKLHANRVPHHLPPFLQVCKLVQILVLALENAMRHAPQVDTNQALHLGPFLFQVKSLGLILQCLDTRGAFSHEPLEECFLKREHLQLQRKIGVGPLMLSRLFQLFGVKRLGSNLVEGNLPFQTHKHQGTQSVQPVPVPCHLQTIIDTNERNAPLALVVPANACTQIKEKHRRLRMASVAVNVEVFARHLPFGGSHIAPGEVGNVIGVHPHCFLLIPPAFVLLLLLIG